MHVGVPIDSKWLPNPSPFHLNAVTWQLKWYSTSEGLFHTKKEYSVGWGTDELYGRPVMISIYMIDWFVLYTWVVILLLLLFSDMICGDAKLRVVCLYQWKAWCLCSHHDVAILLSMRWTRLTPTRTKATRTMKSTRAQFENGDIILRTRRPAFNKTTYWISKPPPTATFAEI